MSESAKKTAPAVPAMPLPLPLSRALGRVIRRHLRTALAYLPVMAALVLSLAWLLQGTVDRFFRLSWGARAALLALDLAVLLVLVWRYGVQPVRRRLNHRKAALLVERKMAFDSALISAVDFCERPGDVPRGAAAVVEQHLENIAGRVGDKDLSSVVDRAPLRRRVKFMVAAVTLALGGIFLAGAELSSVLVQRIFLSRVEIRTDTQVALTTGDFEIEAGTDATLEARAAGIVPATATVVITDAVGKPTRIPVGSLRGEEGVFRYLVKNVREGFTYRFEANDGASATARVSIIVPPAVKELQFVQKYPDYTGLPEETMAAGSLRLLEASLLKIGVTATEPLESAVLDIGGADQPVSLKATDDPAVFVTALRVPASGWKSFSIHLKSKSGRPSVKDPVYRVELVTDKAPSVAMLLPKKDTVTVIPGAKVPVGFRASDDFGLTEVWLRYRITRPGGFEPQEGGIPVDFDRKNKALVMDRTLDLAELRPPVPAGSTIQCWVEATDNNREKHLVKGRSREKTIRVISEEEKRMELLEKIGERARDVEKLYDQQRSMNRQAQELLPQH